MMTPEREKELRKLMEMYPEGSWVELVSDDVLQLLDAIAEMRGNYQTLLDNTVEQVKEIAALKAENERLRSRVAELEHGIQKMREIFDGEGCEFYSWQRVYQDVQSLQAKNKWLSEQVVRLLEVVDAVVMLVKVPTEIEWMAIRKLALEVGHAALDSEGLACHEHNDPDCNVCRYDYPNEVQQ